MLSPNLVTRPRAHAIYWSVTESQWVESLPMLDVVIASFQPAG